MATGDFEIGKENYTSTRMERRHRVWQPAIVTVRLCRYKAHCFHVSRVQSIQSQLPFVLVLPETRETKGISIDKCLGAATMDLSCNQQRRTMLDNKAPVVS